MGLLNLALAILNHYQHLRVSSFIVFSQRCGVFLARATSGRGEALFSRWIFDAAAIPSIAYSSDIAQDISCQPRTPTPSTILLRRFRLRKLAI